MPTSSLPESPLPEPSLPERTTVLIVGGGPVGLLASILLDAQGIDNVVIERRFDVQRAPAAHVINARTFEICRAAGMDFGPIDAACQRPTDGAWVRWLTSLTGDELGAVPFERQDRLGELDAVTPTPLRNLSQHRFEPILRDHVCGLERSALHPGVEWVEARQRASGVASTVCDAQSGDMTVIESSYLIAADGAGSPVRRSLGIEMDGPKCLNATITIHAKADLRHLVADRPATLYWITDPEREGVFVAHDIDDTWVFMHNWNPDVERVEDYTVARCAEIFRRALGTDDAPFEIESISPWMMSCQVATAYRDGRVFLIGDAAHRFPPTGGLGLNTGAVDAQNLAWKLGAVEHGWADERLLDTYESERRPIAHDNAQQSLGNAIKTLDVGVALGRDDDPVTSGRNYDAMLADASGRARVQAATQEQAEHFDMLGLQLGFVYAAAGGAIVGDATVLRTADDPVREYEPTTHPGARLPHAWITRHGARISTLDLVRPDRFVVITSNVEWARAASKLRSDAPLDVVLVGADVVDGLGNWAAVSEIGLDGVLLVRPDQHVGWRSLAVTDDPSGDLRAAFESISGRRVP